MLRCYSVLTLVLTLQDLFGQPRSGSTDALKKVVMAVGERPSTSTPTMDARRPLLSEPARTWARLFFAIFIALLGCFAILVGSQLTAGANDKTYDIWGFVCFSGAMVLLFINVVGGYGATDWIDFLVSHSLILTLSVFVLVGLVADFQNASTQANSVTLLMFGGALLLLCIQSFVTKRRGGLLAGSMKAALESLAVRERKRHH
jgi:hypothetical protein